MGLRSEVDKVYKDKLSGEEFIQFTNDLTNVTEKGPVVSWPERLASIWRLAGLKTSEIGWWKESATAIAQQMVSEAESQGKLTELREAMNQYKKIIETTEPDQVDS